MSIGRTAVLAALIAAAAVPLAARAAARRVEDRAARAFRASVPGATVRSVRFSWRGTLRLHGVEVPLSATTGRAAADVVTIGWRWSGGREPRAHVERVAVRGLRVERGAVALEWPELAVDVLAWERGPSGETVRLREERSGGELEAAWATASREATATMAGFDASGARVLWAGEPVLAPGRWTGRLAVGVDASALATSGDLQGDEVRLAVPRSLGLGGGGFGVPTAIRLAWEGRRAGDRVDVRRASLRIGDVDLAARGQVVLAQPEPLVELEVSAHGELATAFRATGIALPATLSTPRVGTASVEVAVNGPLGDAGSLRVVPRLRFESAPEATARVRFLESPFRLAPADGRPLPIDVRHGAPGFVALDEVPPLFVRALLIAEDAGFYGHPGIDVAEIPVAWRDNAERGGVRGASTITQQLVKNLFLSREKTYGRKIAEAALALVVDAAVPKGRILEIYLNVIEWGPGVHGIGPAARHYFGKSPAELTPRETAFLVCLIPNPLRYHQAHSAGRVGPGMDRLVGDLLTKLRSVDALDDAAYEEALGEELAFLPEGAARAGAAPVPLPSS